MGSWNETCALSNLPIVGGDEVVWIFITEGPYADSKGCGICDYWFPRSVPVFGTYADCGRIEPMEGQEVILDTIMEQFKSDSRTDKIITELKSPLSGSDFFAFLMADGFEERATLVSKGRPLPGENPTGDLSEVRSIMVLRSVWDCFLNTGVTLGHTEEITNSTKIINAANETVDAIVDHVASGAEYSLVMMRLGERLGQYDSEIEDINMFFDRIYSPSLGGWPTYSNTPKTVFHNVLKKLYSGLDSGISESNVRKVFKNIAELMHVETVMLLSRMSWHPTVGAGSQLEENLLWLKLQSSIAKVAMKKVENNLAEALEMAEYDSPPDNIYYTNIAKKLKSELDSFRVSSPLLQNKE